MSAHLSEHQSEHLSGYSFELFLKIIEPLYLKKDPAHGLGHIRRVYSKAAAFVKSARSGCADKTILALGAVLHGVVCENRAEAEKLLLTANLPPNLIDRGMEVAMESQANAVPKSESIEGRALHDAHLCEGGEDFIAAKSFVTASFNNYPIQETYKWVSDNILNNPSRRCYTPEGKRDYSKKLRRLKKTWGEILDILGGHTIN